MNIYDISEKAGVSIATVSRVINGSSQVSEKTKQRVLDIIEEYGYTPNVFARGLGLNSMKTIGIMCADCSDSYLARAVYFIEQDLRRNNYDAILCCTGYALDTKKSSLDLLMSKRVDGIILVGSNYVDPNDENNEYIRTAAASVPIMLVNGALSANNLYCTLCDDFNAIYEITQRFIKGGKTNPIYMYNSHSYSGLRKVDGFKAAMKANSLSVKEERLVFLKSDSSNVHYTKNVLIELKKKGVKFDGVITSDDIIAVGALKYAKETGLKVPEDFFVAGFNNFNIGECCDPELTSVDNKLESLCHHCVSTLMGVFDGKSMPKSTLFSAEIVERGTTKFIN